MGDRLHGKVALVTGAGSIGPGIGNGKATSILCAREGAKVFAVDMNLDAAKETASMVEGEGGAAIAHQADVTDTQEVAALVEACEKTYGRIDILVNNVGIARTGGIVSTEEADWDLVTDVNQKSVYLMCRAVAPIMQRQGKGAIVNIASIAAHRWTGINYASYYATKGAVVALSRAIALEFAQDGIRCNSVSPGLMNTPMVHHGLTAAYGAEGDVDNLVKQRDAQCPTGKMGTAWDTAYACLFLASDEAGYVNAHDLVVDGGMIAKFV
ncbi:MAG: SDR family oxidoreductase [Alphaproteobacteria bacterium]|nr:SDR family oxidoreductase [Alphaproteobacteria bacterium]